MTKKQLRLLLPVSFVIYVFGCSVPDYSDLDKSWNYGFNSATKFVMTSKYYWNENLPENIEVTTADPNAFIKPLLNEIDLEKGYTYFTKVSSYYSSLVGSSSSTEHGFHLIERDGKLYIKTVIPDSKAAESGQIERGYRLVTINNNAVPDNLIDTFKEIQKAKSNTFTFENTDGNEITVTDLKKSVTTTPFIHSFDDGTGSGSSNKGKILNTANTADVVGYMLYSSFLHEPYDELIEALEYFNNQGITELILDLRYNGGGFINSAIATMSALTEKENLGKPAIYLKFSSTNTTADSSVYNFFTETQIDNNKLINLDLERVFVLTTRSSASASELLIKGLEPYMDVHHIGTTTYGKPVGQSLFSSHENYGYYFRLVTFSYFNQDAYMNNDFSESRLFFNGIIPDYEISEFRKKIITSTGTDKTVYVLEPFGSEDDPLVAAALHYIKNGSYPAVASTALSSSADTWNSLTAYQNETFPMSGLFLSPEIIMK